MNRAEITQTMKSDKRWQATEAIFREAMKCRQCFDRGIAKPSLIDVAQPRWIGPRYFDASLRVLVVSLNPGAGNTAEKQRLNRPFRQVMYDYRDGSKTLQDLFAFQRQYIPQWGTPSGRFVRFYMDSMGFVLDKVALANIAWCADGNNKWPESMLSQCFQLFTRRLIIAVSPDIAILSGSGTHKYAPEVERLVPGCKAVCTLHYAHRKGRDAELAEFKRVRNLILSLSKARPF